MAIFAYNIEKKKHFSLNLNEHIIHINYLLTVMRKLKID